MILNDMGGKWRGYCSDVTCCFPSSGKFTEKQKLIYNAVLDANRTVIS
jgi:Xaa-Pro aminopeptidase